MMRYDPLLTEIVCEQLGACEEKQAPSLKPHLRVLRAPVAFSEEAKNLITVLIVVF